MENTLFNARLFRLYWFSVYLHLRLKEAGPPFFTKSHFNVLTSVVDRNWFHKFGDKGPSGEIYGHGIKAEKS